MKWAKTIRHQACVEVDGEIFNVLCESEEDDISVIINREYVADVEKLPTYEELMGLIEQHQQINNSELIRFPGEGI